MTSPYLKLEAATAQLRQQMELNKQTEGEIGELEKRMKRLKADLALALEQREAKKAKSAKEPPLYALVARFKKFTAQILFH